MSEEHEVGKVVGYFGKISVAAVQVTGGFAVGDTLRFHGHTTDFTTSVESMQIEGQNVQSVSPGDSVGIKVPDKTRNGDSVFRVVAG